MQRRHRLLQSRRGDSKCLCCFQSQLFRQKDGMAEGLRKLCRQVTRACMHRELTGNLQQPLTSPTVHRRWKIIGESDVLIASLGLAFLVSLPTISAAAGHALFWATNRLLQNTLLPCQLPIRQRSHRSHRNTETQKLQATSLISKSRSGFQSRGRNMEAKVS